MAIVTTPAILHMLDDGEMPRLAAVQGDTGREILCKFKGWSAPASATATIYVELPSGATASTACTNNGDGTITAPLTSAMLAESGKARGMVEVTYSTTATSFPFWLMIYDKIGG